MFSTNSVFVDAQSAGVECEQTCRRWSSITVIGSRPGIVTRNVKASRGSIVTETPGFASRNRCAMSRANLSSAGAAEQHASERHSKDNGPIPRTSVIPIDAGRLNRHLHRSSPINYVPDAQ